MITAEQRELIAAGVDGELSTAEARALRQLLVHMPEARDLLEQLKADRARVRTIPQAAPPADLKAKVMARVAALPLARPAQPAAPAKRSRLIQQLAPVAVAACVLVAITAGSFAYFDSQTATKTAAKALPWDVGLHSPNPTPSLPTPGESDRPRPDADANAHNTPPSPPVAPLPKEVLPRAVAVAPFPRPITHDLIGSQILPKLPPFDLVEVRLPFLRAVAELEGDDVRKELRDEVGRGDLAFRFDLFVRNTTRGVDVIENAAKAAGVKLFVDAATREKLKKKQVYAAVIYTESLTPAELAAFFAQLAAEDKKFSPRVCDTLHATPAGRIDELELKLLLGMDPGLFKRPAEQGRGETSSDPGAPKPVSEGTIDMVTDALTKPNAKAPKSAVLLTWSTTQPNVSRTNPAMSAELKRFLAKRGDRKPNAVPAIIVIRPVG